MNFNYSFELFELNESLTPYGTIETQKPEQSNYTINDFTEGDHFRTGPENGTNYLTLKLENRILSIVLDESGSMTWNDQKADRYTFLKRLLTKLKNTYPEQISVNLIGFGGVQVLNRSFTTKAGNNFKTFDGLNFEQFMQSIYEDSVYDFSGVQVVRRTDRYPTHPADGVVVARGIITALHDQDLTEGITYYYGIWTFNKNNHYSQGKFISVPLTERNIPYGVNFASANARILPGVQRDDNTCLIFNFAEKSGNIILDSSGQGNHGTINSETILDNFWGGDASENTYTNDEELKYPVGVKFDGEFDVVSLDIDEQFSIIGENHSNSHGLTINLWIYRHDVNSNTWIIGTTQNESSNNIGWAIGLNSSGEILLSLDANIQSGFAYTISSAIIPEQSWTMLTISIDTNCLTHFYINSILVHTENFSPGPDINILDTTKLLIGAKITDSGNTWTGNDFAGILNQISISNIDRDQEWITKTYQQESNIFNRSTTDFTITPPDNLQREVIIRCEITNDANLENGTVKIIRKYQSIPANDTDGEAVTEFDAITGESIFVDTFDFIHNSNYYYRVFTYNQNNIQCDHLEAKSLFTYINSSLPDSNIVSPVTNAQITTGNQKILLEWDNPNNNFSGIRIYFGTDRFPTITRSPQGILEVSDGKLLIDLTNEFFVHRTNGQNCNGSDILLSNGLPHYYTIVTYNLYNQISEPVNLFGIPSSNSTAVFISPEVKDVYYNLIDSSSASLQWEIPTVRNNRLDLYFDEFALYFFNITDIYGTNLNDIDNLNLKVCTKFLDRGLKTSEKPLNTDNGLDTFNELFNPSTPCSNTNSSSFGTEQNDNCNTPESINETSVKSTTLNNGILKGIVSPILDPAITFQRRFYEMVLRTEYAVTNDDKTLFKFYSEPCAVTFTHPLKISLINKLNKFIVVNCVEDGKSRGEDVCSCTQILGKDPCEQQQFNGGYVQALKPYVCRVEIQWKGESLPDGTPILVGLFRHDENNSRSLKSDRTTIREGQYITTSIEEDELDYQGIPTGNKISKSIADIEIIHPSLPDFVDLYVIVNFNGFSIDAVQEIKFISSLFIQANISKPSPNGIDVAEQFATVWQVDPDDPFNPESNRPTPDGTLIKWELVPLRHGKPRPFYSIEEFNILISGVYSTTTNGVARHIFLGPIGNLEKHVEQLTCKDEDGAVAAAEICCLSEEYEIHAQVILDELVATDAVKIAYECEDKNRVTNKRFLMNIAPDQTGSNPHWITWADGIHLLKFQIAKNPSISEIVGAECFRQCVESQDGGQLFTFPEEQIIQIVAPGDVLWDAEFEIEPYTGESTLINYQISKSTDDEYGSLTTALIPLRSETTDFYLRLNRFIDSNNPQPEKCESGSGGGDGNGSGGFDLSPCTWKNICKNIGVCTPTEGNKWINVDIVSGTTTLIINNKETTLFGGGDYESGIPPIYAGFKEPLDVRIIDARVNGKRVSELIVDGISIHTFVVEITFSGESVPDGTPVELSVQGSNQNIILLSQSTVYTDQVNDDLINPTGNLRSLAYFTIQPLPNVNFDAQINVVCHYDKLGTIKRNIKRCIRLTNTVNSEQSNEVPPGNNETPIENSASSNELISYDSVENIYSNLPSGRIKRIGHFCISGTGSHTGSLEGIYMFGGWTANSESGTASITPISEVFTPSTQEWAFITDMPTPRCFGMCVSKNNKVYCIGGVELDAILDQHVVSKKIEVYNTQHNNWTTLTNMPDSYGIAYGDAQIIDNDIYVVCGITEIIDNSKPGTLNNKILKYSIADNIWSIIDVNNESLYQRIAPFGFYRSIDNKYYIYGGSILKSRSQIEAERTVKTNQLLNEFRSFILTSNYFLNLLPADQSAFISEQEQTIRNSVIVPAYVYPQNGFRFNRDLSDDLENLSDQWKVSPKPRSHGKSIYISHQDIAYFIGGSNQNFSTTLNTVESIDFVNNNLFDHKQSLSRGRAMFGATNIDDTIYISGGLTSGHADGWAQIEIKSMPEFVETTGRQSCGLSIGLFNDAGEIIHDDILVDIKGRIRIDALDNLLIDFAATRATNRALGGDGSTNLPTDENLTNNELQDAQNTIIDPNSDEFQHNAATGLVEQMSILPIIYSKNQTTLIDGSGDSRLMPRSEDPLSDFDELGAFIKELLNNTPQDFSDSFNDTFTIEELFALGDALQSVTINPTVINSNLVRNLYNIETTVTILDDFYFGQTVSDLDIAIQQQTQEKINDILNPPPDNENPPPSDNENNSGESCFILQHSAQPDVPPPPPIPDNDGSDNPGGTGGFSQSGQCLFCESILPLNVDIRSQLFTPKTTFFNIVKWIPQIKSRLAGNNSSLQDAINELDVIDHEVPFGGSPLYDALNKTAEIMTGDDFDIIKKSIYIASDNTQNISIATRDECSDNINAIDGDKNVPAIYTIFSTSFPISLSALFERSSIGDADKITQSTGGQSTTLTSSDFISQILNLALSSALGGLGYGIYHRRIIFDDLTFISEMTLNFILPNNTQGFARIRHSTDGYVFTDYSEKYIGTQNVDFADFSAKIIDLEITLSTGFTTNESDDSTSTSLPKTTSVNFVISDERDDYIFINPENADSSPLQIAAAFEGTIPNASSVEIGSATSDSSNWQDFQSQSRPAMQEFGKTFLLDRQNITNTVGLEHLITQDYILYRAFYGPWNPTSQLQVYRIDENDNEVEINNSFQSYPRDGFIYFNTKQSPTLKYKIKITDTDITKIAVRLRNRNHTESITMEGVGYVYSTSEDKQSPLGEAPPIAIEVNVSPTKAHAGDTFFALYKFFSLSNRTESGSKITWYKNNLQLFEIQNKTSWANTDLTQSHKLQPGDKIQFSIIPSDGQQYGEQILSPIITIGSRVPSVENLKIIPQRNNSINSRYDTSSDLILQYDFSTEDSGPNSIESGTIIKWFVNGTLFKEGTFTAGEEDPYNNPKSLIAAELINGASAHLIGNLIYAEIIPSTFSVSGSATKTNTITIVNSAPIIQSPLIQPLVPNSRSTLTVTYTIQDRDISVGTQTDRSEIQWFNSSNGTDFTEITDLKNQKTVKSSFLNAGDKWYALITPYDGLDVNDPVKTNIVNIQV